MAQPDELIDFHHLKSRRGMSQLELEDEVATDLQKATGLVDTHTTDSSHLNRVLQLTGAPCQESRPPHMHAMPASKASCRSSLICVACMLSCRMQHLENQALESKLVNWAPVTCLCARGALPPMWRAEGNLLDVRFLVPQDP